MWPGGDAGSGVTRAKAGVSPGGRRRGERHGFGKRGAAARRSVGTHRTYARIERATLRVVIVEATGSHAWDDPASGFLLVVLAGGSPRALPLPSDGEVVLGRGDACGMTVDDASVSREHAVLRIHGGIVTIEDLGSRNGTRLAGRKLSKGEAAEVALDQIIELGAVVIAVKGPAGAPRAGGLKSTVAGSQPVALVSLGLAMERAYALADLVAPTPVTVLLLGETGVGKTAAAERLHAQSRRTGPLVKLNCAAVPEALLEGELFGYERGAFTGAQVAKAGLIEAAHGGTLLLDEIGDMPLATQAKLLHVVEEGEVTRLGALKPRSIDVRFIAATHRDLTKMVEAGTFRADLYYRVNGIAITIPPLRERQEEIAGLAAHFLSLTCAKLKREPPVLGAAALAALCAYPWPGNLRELRNVMDRAALLARDAEVTVDVLGLPAVVGIVAAPPAPLDMRPAGPTAVTVPPAAPSGNLRDELDSYEREKIVRALEEAGGNQARAAQLCGLPLRTFVKRLTHHGLTRARAKKDG